MWSFKGVNEFLISFLGRVFTLLENLPDASRVRSGSPEEYVVNSLPAAFTPLLAALSPELYDVALDKIANFVTNETSLPPFSERDADVQAYVQGLRDCIVGSLHWLYETDRYFGDTAEDVRSSGWVFLS